MSQTSNDATRLLLEGLANVGGCVIANEDGRLLEAEGNIPDGELWAAHAVTMVRAMTTLGAALQLGEAHVITVQTRLTTHVLGAQGGLVAAVAVDPRRQTSDVETRLLDRDWSSPLREPPQPLLDDSFEESFEESMAGSIEQAIEQAIEEPRPPAPPPAQAQAQAAERPSVFSGTLQLFAVADLLEFLRNAQRTGTLRCRSPEGVGTVQLVRGRITNATSPATGGLLDYLITSGMLEPEQLDEILAAVGHKPASDGVMARLLLDRGMATPATLRAVLSDRIHMAIADLVTWTDGRFAFDSGAPVDAAIPGVDVELDSQPVLLNIFKQQDEASKPR